jgi:hypothetical protein
VSQICLASCEGWSRWAKVEIWVKSSLHPVQISQQLLLLKRELKNAFMKVGENAEGFAAFKASPISHSDALLALVGKIIHRYLNIGLFYP